MTNHTKNAPLQLIRRPIFNLKAPELYGTPVSKRIVGNRILITHDPTDALTIDQLLRIRPLNQELIRGVKVGSDAPFSEPHRHIADRLVCLQALQVLIEISNLRTKKRDGRAYCREQ
jgi:hypothetical protein